MSFDKFSVILGVIGTLLSLYAFIFANEGIWSLISAIYAFSYTLVMRFVWSLSPMAETRASNTLKSQFESGRDYQNITISKELYEELLDYWIWYDDSLEEYRKRKENYDSNKSIS